MLIGLIGQKLTGKDTIARYLESKYGVVSFAAGHILNDILHILAQDVSRENEVRLAVALRGAFGETVLNTAILHRLAEHGDKVGLINGIRRPAEVTEAKAAGARIVYVTASAELRYERYMQRREKKDDGTLSFAEFVAQDQQSPTEKDIPALAQEAEYTITNSGDLSELYAQVDAYMAQVQ